MSKLIQLTWTDEADNETTHSVYRGSDLNMTSASGTFLFKIDWDGTSWNIDSASQDSSINSIQVLQDGGAPTTVSQDFQVEFVDTVLGEHYYGVSASNATGASDVVPSSSSILID
jgi:hypothetical protein